MIELNSDQLKACKEFIKVYKKCKKVNISFCQIHEAIHLLNGDFICEVFEGDENLIENVFDMSRSITNTEFSAWIDCDVSVRTKNKD